MNPDTITKTKNENEKKTILVAMDFSDCSKAAYRKACTIFRGDIEKIIALHVIDSEFVKRCVTHRVGKEGQIKKTLFLNAKEQLKEFIAEEKETDVKVEPVICEGVPYLEITRKAHEFNVEMIIIGSYGKAGDTERIFFGSTAEKLLRFITHPILCIPPVTGYGK